MFRCPRIHVTYRRDYQHRLVFEDNAGSFRSGVFFFQGSSRIAQGNLLLWGHDLPEGPRAMCRGTGRIALLASILGMTGYLNRLGLAAYGLSRIRGLAQCHRGAEQTQGAKCSLHGDLPNLEEVPSASCRSWVAVAYQHRVRV